MHRGRKWIDFSRRGAPVDILKSSRRAMGRAASGIRRYVSFCEIKGIRPFPAKGKYILQRSPLFNEKETSQQYVNSLKEA